MMTRALALLLTGLFLTTLPLATQTNPVVDFPDEQPLTSESLNLVCPGSRRAARIIHRLANGVATQRCVHVIVWWQRHAEVSSLWIRVSSMESGCIVAISRPC